jgi:GT2 family glycosyltransferase
VDAARPPVDVVVPFHGSDAALTALLDRLERLRRRDGDTVTVADNRATATTPWQHGSVRVLAAPAEQSSYHARNVAARAGRNPWLLFIDADVEPPPALVESYFAQPMGERVGVVAGAIEDAPATLEDGVAARYAYLEQTLAHDNVLAGDHAFAQTANALVRREAFEAVGGFTEGIRSGGDADICFRIVAAGWKLDTRPATVAHTGRPTVRKLLRQYLRYGAGAAWLDERHPGFLEVRPWRHLVGSSLRGAVRGAQLWLRGDRDAAIVTALRPLTRACFRAGSSLPNAAVPTTELLRRALTRGAPRAPS